MSAYQESWEDNISEEEQWAKINTDRKRSSYIEKGCFENHTTTAAELNIHLEDPGSTKTVRREFTNPKSTVVLQLLNL
jgi:hypothetical protein